MAKGDDAVRKKKNKVLRKRFRNSENAVSARIAAIIATKRRRKNGKRRQCEGMCFTLPTPEDPFNDRSDPKNKTKKLVTNNKQRDTYSKKEEVEDEEPKSSNSTLEDAKFITLCLNTFKNSSPIDNDKDSDSMKDLLASASSWGIKLWKQCCSRENVVINYDKEEDCLIHEHLVWMLSIAFNIFAKNEKEGKVATAAAASPFLLFIVPTQQMATQVRSACKPLKALGIHTVSVHPGAQLQHQIQGLKNCEPEFLVSTPDRLLELVGLQAIDISAVSLLVIDGLKGLIDSGLLDTVKSIKNKINGEPKILVFNNSSEKSSGPLLQSLAKKSASIPS